MKDSATMSKTLKDLGIKHGTLITIPPSKSLSSSLLPPSPIIARKQRRGNGVGTKPWNPYPDLAKDYDDALWKSKTRRGTMKSYSDVAELQSSLHIVEPQQEGKIKRIYMCRRSAERFYTNGIEKPKMVKTAKKGTSAPKPTIVPRCGLLFGTIQKEKAEGSIPKKARTSLSSTTKEDSTCQVIKVQAVWEPPGQTKNAKSTSYDNEMASRMLSTASIGNSDESTEHSRVLKLASRLALQPVGWIYSTRSPKTTTTGRDTDDDDDKVPVDAIDVWTGAKLQIENMKRLHDDGDKSLKDGDANKGDKFVSVSMDAESGTTEAFQLSCVTIQMVHEDVFVSVGVASSRGTKNKGGSGGSGGDGGNNPKIALMRHPVLVDGRETTELDSVLCLINTALLSHDGSFSGSSAASSVKKSNGTLTNKAKKDLLAVIEKGDDRYLMEELCDFNLLLALDLLLDDNDMVELCELVRKWSRGLKKGTAIGPKLKMKLQSLLA
jgi:hypothetical protein